MPIPRPQFSIRTLLWLTLLVAAFLGGSEWQQRSAKRRFTGSTFSGTERVRKSNGKVMYKVVLRGRPGETMFTTDNGDTVTIEFSHD